MKEYVDTWGIYNWNFSHGENFIHPEDYKRVEEYERAYQVNFFRYKIFYCASINDDGYLALEYREQQYHVRPDLYQIVPTPKFVLGDHVREINDHSREGVIYQVVWHYKRKRVYYHVRRGERYSNKYNFENEIELIP